MYKIEILKTIGEQPYYWRVKAGNGQIFLTSEKYVRNPRPIAVKFLHTFFKRGVIIEDLTR